MEPVSREYLINKYQRALDERYAAMFLGAGMSRPAGHVDWQGLMRGIARELKLDVDKETDLIAIAQYHVNQKKTRAALNQLLVDEFTRDVKPTDSHRLIATLPISTIWTTNYDRLIEEAFEAEHKRVDRKVTHDDLTTTKPGRDVTVYKMHGDIESPNDAVLTKADYEEFSEKRRFFSMQLQGDLLSKTFLFVGYSFSDPNIDYILGRIRSLVGKPKREHFYITKGIERPTSRRGSARADFDYKNRRLALRIDDLQHYGVQTYLVDDYSEINVVLQQLARRVRRRNVFVSGSAHGYAPLTRERVECFSRALGGLLIERGFNAVSGMGLGIGGAVTIGALEALYRSRAPDLEDRLILRPFPQVAPTTGSLAEIWTRYRVDMISRAGVAIFICGNKVGPEGEAIEAGGVLEEFALAKEHGLYPIPIGATGSASQKIWREVSQDPKRFFGEHATKAKGPLAALNDKRATNDSLLKAVSELLALVAPK